MSAMHSENLAPRPKADCRSTPASTSAPRTQGAAASFIRRFSVPHCADFGRFARVREVIYGFGELDELVLAYATTIHKSQGSEYPAVIIPLTTQHFPMLQQNLVYTGVTRGKRLVVLVGQRKALAIAVKGKQTRRRWSKFGEWLGRQAPIQSQRQRTPLNKDS